MGRQPPSDRAEPPERDKRGRALEQEAEKDIKIGGMEPTARPKKPAQ